jgi:DNA-binding LacI/PurR family transcriptional regulator
MNGQQVFMIEQPAEEMGRQSAQLLFRRLRNAGVPYRQRLLPAVMREMGKEIYVQQIISDSV